MDVTLSNFVEAIGIVVSGGWQDERLKAARQYLESSVTKQQTISICHEIITQHQDDQSITLMAAILLQQSVIHFWNTADDEYRKSSNQDIYKEKLSSLVGLYQSLFRDIQNAPPGPLSLTDLQRVRLIGVMMKKGLCLTSGFDEEWMSDFVESIFGASMKTTLFGCEKRELNLLQRSRMAIIFTQVIEQILATDDLQKTGITHKAHLALLRKIENPLIINAFYTTTNIIYNIAKAELGQEAVSASAFDPSTAEFTYLDCELRLLIVLFQWNFGPSRDRLARFVCHSDLADLLLAYTEPFGGTLKDRINHHPNIPNIFYLVTELREFVEASHPIHKLLGPLVTRLATARITSISGERSNFRTMPLAQRRSVISQATFHPLFLRTLNRASRKEQLLLSSLNENETEDLVASLLEDLQTIEALILNPDCALTQLFEGCTLQVPISLLNFFVILLNYLRQATERNFSEQLTHLLDASLRVYSYIAHLMACSIGSEDRSALESNIGPSLSNFLTSYWRFFDVDDRDDLYEDKQEIAISREDDEPPNSVLKTKGFDLEEDRYLARIGMYAEVSRLAPNRIISDLMSRVSGSLNDPDFIRFAFLFLTALLTDEGNSISGKAPEEPRYFYREIGAFNSARGSIPWALRNHELANAGSLFEKLLTSLFASDGDGITIFNLKRISPLVCVSVSVFVTRIIRTYCFAPSQSPTESSRVLFPNISQSPMATALLDKAIQFYAQCIQDFSGEPEVIRLSLLGLGTMVKIGAPTHPHIWTCPSWSPKIVEMTLTCAPVSYRTVLSAPDLTKLAEIVALSVAVSEQDVELLLNENVRREITNDRLTRQAHVLVACNPLKRLQLLINDESGLKSCCALLRGLIRGFTRMADASFFEEKATHLVTQSFWIILTWLFTKRTYTDANELVQAANDTRQNPSFLMTDLEWLESLANIPKTHHPIVHAQICGLLKVTFHLCTTTKILAFDQLLPFLKIFQKDVCAQIEAVRTFQADDSRWLKSIITLLKKLITWASTKRAPQEAEMNLTAQQLVMSTTLPFVKSVVEDQVTLLSLDDPDHTSVFISWTRLAIFVFGPQRAGVLDFLTTPKFVKNILTLIKQGLDKSAVCRLATNEALSELCLRIVDSVINGEARSMECFEEWRWPLNEMLFGLLLSALTEPHKDAKLGEISDLCSLLTFVMAVDEAAFASSIKQFHTAVVAQDAKIEVALKDHCEQIFTFGVDGLRQRRESLKVNENMVAWRHMRALQSQFYVKIFQSLIFDCRLIK